jgi:aerobic-type carbon monoxide dehydrogenase small subunit (CoxS/CutS family)
VVTVTVNAQEYTVEVEARTSLADLLRHTLRLTGTHVGCEEGVCGSCTVLVDSEPVRSCLTLAVQVPGQAVETVEGLAADGALTAMQSAMVAEHGLQCGFCTPGILMSLAAAERAKLPCTSVIQDVLGGHICRCTGYRGIWAAVQRRWAALDAEAADD